MSRRHSSRWRLVAAAQLVRRSVPFHVVFSGALVTSALSMLSAARSESLTLLTENPRATRTAALPEIEISDNRKPSGQLEQGVLTLRLEARNGVWYPEGPNGLGLTVAAFAEEGKPLQNPGPLVRVPAGTEVHILARNSLDKPLTLFGLGATRGVASDSVVVESGAVREIRFRVTDPGTYYYAGKTTTKGTLFNRLQEDSQLNGAIIVDPPGAVTGPNDRIFMISWWVAVNPQSPTGLDRASFVINGRSWPHTEHLDVTQGDSLHWRWINFTDLEHPMHLHGFYFRVDGVGDGRSFTTYAPVERRQAVTEVVRPGRTMSLTWSPTRPGNWVFHCHFVGHISHLVSLGTLQGVPATEQPSGHAEHRVGGMTHQMSGLVLGIRVAPNGVAAAKPKKDDRRLRLIVRSRPNVYGTRPGYAYVLGGTEAERDTTTLRLPGPTLVLEKDQPVAITIVNQSQAPAAVHWHGIELDSYPDGVPGWSGGSTSPLPAIAPNDSLTVRFTPPRAGTFMYHSHFDEFGQIASGLYGAIVVLDRGRRFDGVTDRVLLFSDDGPTNNVLMGPFPRALLNGKAQPDPIDLRVGVTYRFRLINIRTDYPASVALLDPEQPVDWRLVAKDGADLPPAQVTVRPAMMMFAAGEIYDVEFTPRRPGDLTLQFGMPKLGPIPGQATTVPLRVR